MVQLKGKLRLHFDPYNRVFYCHSFILNTSDNIFLVYELQYDDDEMLIGY